MVVVLSCQMTTRFTALAWSLPPGKAFLFDSDGNKDPKLIRFGRESAFSASRRIGNCCRCVPCRKMVLHAREQRGSLATSKRHNGSALSFVPSILHVFSIRTGFPFGKMSIQVNTKHIHTWIVRHRERGSFLLPTEDGIGHCDESTTRRRLHTFDAKSRIAKMQQTKRTHALVNNGQ